LRIEHDDDVGVLRDDLEAAPYDRCGPGLVSYDLHSTRDARKCEQRVGTILAPLHAGDYRGRTIAYTAVAASRTFGFLEEPDTTPVEADCATADPTEFEAVTLKRKVEPTSAATSAYAVDVAPEIGAQAPLFESQRSH